MTTTPPFLKKTLQNPTIFKSPMEEKHPCRAVVLTQGDSDPNQCLETSVFVITEGLEGPECCKHPTLPWKHHREEYLPQMLSDWG